MVTTYTNEKLNPSLSNRRIVRRQDAFSIAALQENNTFVIVDYRYRDIHRLLKLLDDRSNYQLRSGIAARTWCK